MRRKKKIRMSANSATRKGGFLKFIFFLILILLVGFIFLKSIGYFLETYTEKGGFFMNLLKDIIQ